MPWDIKNTVIEPKWRKQRDLISADGRYIKPFDRTLGLG